MLAGASGEIDAERRGVPGGILDPGASSPLPMDPMAFPIRSPRDQVGGIYVFGRILDKIRLQAREGRLPDGYHLGLIPGSRTFDDRVWPFPWRRV